MSPRPPVSDAHAHADGPLRRFGTAPRPQGPAQPTRPDQPVQPQPQPRRERPVPTVGVLPALQSLLYLLVVALFITAFVVQPIRIPSASMEPTLLVGDFLLLNKEAGAGDHAPLPRWPVRRGDVVVFHDPVDPSIHLVKRVIGLPGDRLRLSGGNVILNGTPLPEPYAIHRPAPPDPFRDSFPDLESMDAAVDPAWWIRLRGLVHNGEVTVPTGQLFMLGDNRNDSEDSRYWGFVPRDAIVGEPLLIYFSWAGGATGNGAAGDGDRGLHAGRALNRTHPAMQTSAGPADFARWDRTLRVIH